MSYDESEAKQAGPSGRLIARRSAIGRGRASAAPRQPTRRTSARVAREAQCGRCQTTQRVGGAGQCPACGDQIAPDLREGGAGVRGPTREVYCDTCEAPRHIGGTGRCPTCQEHVVAPLAERPLPPPSPGSGGPPPRAQPTDERTGLWSEYCPRCKERRTHTRHGCSGCAMRAGNRRQGALYAVVGLLVIACTLATALATERRTIWHNGLLGFGGFLLARGLHGMLVGSNPERE